MKLRRGWMIPLGAAVCAGALAGQPAFAEGSGPKQSAQAPQPATAHQEITADVELTRAAIQVRRQALVTAAMDLTPDEEQAFWPLYHEYREEIAKANDPFVALLTSYLETGGELSNDEAAKALTDYLAIEEARTNVQKQFVPRFLERLAAVKVVRFFQVDHKLDAIVDAELAATVPLAR